MDKQMEKQLIDRFGFVPDFYRTVPEVAQSHAWGMQRDLELPGTRLDPKVKELIGLAISAHIKCRYCIYFHSQVARAYGATDEELREAVFMGGFTVAMSNALNGAEYDLNKFHGEVDRALKHIESHAPQPHAH
jgi:AhpD family alkylhydroperoxidase